MCNNDVIDSVAVKYGDFSKAANDFLSKDFPAGSIKVEGKTLSLPNKSFTLTVNKDVHSGAITEELENKFSVPLTKNSSGVPAAKRFLGDSQLILSSTTTINSNNFLTEKVELKNAVGKGVNLDFTGTLVPSGQHGVKVGLSYNHECIVAASSLDVMRGPLVNTNVAVRGPFCWWGAELGYDLGKGKVEKYSVAAAFHRPDYKVVFQAHTGFNLFSASFFQAIPQSGLQMGYRASWNRKVPSSLSMEAGARYNLGDGKSFVKAKIDNNGKLGVSYSSSISSNVALTLGACVDTAKLSENSHKLGLSLVFGD